MSVKMDLTINQKKKLIYYLKCPECKQITEFYINDYDLKELTSTFQLKCIVCSGWFKITIKHDTEKGFGYFLNEFYNKIAKKHSLSYQKSGLNS